MNGKPKHLHTIEMVKSRYTGQNEANTAQNPPKNGKKLQNSGHFHTIEFTLVVEKNTGQNGPKMRKYGITQAFITLEYSQW